VNQKKNYKYQYRLLRRVYTGFTNKQTSRSKNNHLKIRSDLEGLKDPNNITKLIEIGIIEWEE